MQCIRGRPMTAFRTDRPMDNGRWRAASASIAPNDAYVGARLQFRGPDSVEHAMADTVDKLTARRILRRLLIGMLLLSALSASQSFSSGLQGADSSGGGSGGLGATGIMLALGTLTWLGFVLFVPMRETLSEWNLVVDDRADLSESAYATVAEDLLQRRQIPAQVFPRRKFVRMPQPGIRNFLLVKLGKYFMFVSVFGFGRDLYLGWSLIRRDIPAIFLLRYFAAKVATDPGYSRLID